MIFVYIYVHPDVIDEDRKLYATFFIPELRKRIAAVKALELTENLVNIFHPMDRFPELIGNKMLMHIRGYFGDSGVDLDVIKQLLSEIGDFFTDSLMLDRLGIDTMEYCVEGLSGTSVVISAPLTDADTGSKPST